jgi:hypothetical protein
VAVDAGTLIVAHDRKFRWTVAERPWRSVIVGPDGRVLSAGFPKFANYGEPGFDDHAQALRDALASDEPVWVTDKLDGSLCIRSVIDGQVVLRTRGTPDGAGMAAPMRAVAKARYPALLDPARWADRSLLLEFVSPQHRVVLAYDRDDLILTGAVTHATFELANRDELAAIAQAGDLRLVDSQPLPRSVRELTRQVAAWENAEGVVARCRQGQVMVKVKSRGYLAMHRLRSNFTLREVRRLCDEHDICDVDAFEQVAARMGADWEILQDARPTVEALLGARQRAAARIDELDAEVLALCMRLPGRRRDVIAHINDTVPAGEREAALLLADGQTDAALAALRGALVDEAVSALT